MGIRALKSIIGLSSFFNEDFSKSHQNEGLLADFDTRVHMVLSELLFLRIKLSFSFISKNPLL